MLHIFKAILLGQTIYIIAMSVSLSSSMIQKDTHHAFATYSASAHREPKFRWRFGERVEVPLEEANIYRYIYIWMHMYKWVNRFCGALVRLETADNTKCANHKSISLYNRVWKS